MEWIQNNKNDQLSYSETFNICISIKIRWYLQWLLLLIYIIYTFYWCINYDFDKIKGQIVPYDNFFTRAAHLLKHAMMSFF